MSHFATVGDRPWALLVAAGAVAAASLAACAAPLPSGASTQPVEVRVLVKLVRPSDDFAAIGAEASRRAGVAVTHRAAASSSWHALALRCADAAQCEGAIERLRHAGTVYEAVELEGRMQRAS
ncbi:MAG: hypothetical protein ABJA61_03865 [Caldimonas sp.]